MTRLKSRAGAVALALIGLTGFAAVGADMATASAPPPCPAGFRCEQDPVDFIDTSPTALNQFIVSDPSNAPQFSVGVGAASSWANPFCVTNNPLTDHRLMYVACMGGASGNGQGRPVITLTANDGAVPAVTLVQNGHSYTLTAGDVALLNAMRAAGITPRDLRMLGRWLHATGR